MSHETGQDRDRRGGRRKIYLRYHRAKDEADRGRFMIYKRDDKAVWMDDLEPVDAESPKFAPSPRPDYVDGPD